MQELKFDEKIKTSPIKSQLLINTINSYYPQEIVKYYTPEDKADEYNNGQKN